ncbi:MAG: response regulator [Gemmatimonadota bacterium]
MPSPMQRALILLVEDQPHVRRMLTRYLGGCGHTVTEAVDAEQALDCLERARYDVILSDIHIPGMSGLDLALQFADEAPHTPLVLMTGDPDERVEILGRRSGAVGYLRKPFPFSELDETLALALCSIRRTPDTGA